MTQYAFNNAPGFAVEGMTVSDRRSRTFNLDYRAEVQTIALADGSPNAGEVVTVAITDEHEVVWSYTFLTGASVAVSVANMTAAHRLNAKANSLFSITDDAATTGTLTARHANKVYSIAVTVASGSMTFTVTKTVLAGGDGIEPARFVRRVSDLVFDGLLATSVLSDIAGITFRTDGNVLHDRELSPLIDYLRRGKAHSIMGWGVIWVRPETAVAPGQPVYVRRAVTGSVGTVGKVRSSPTGSAQTLTVTPIVNQGIYGFSMTYVYQGVRHVLRPVYMPTDATTSIADACAGLFDALTAEIVAHGLTGVLTPTDNATTLTVATVVGGAITEPSANVWYLDTEAATVTLSNGTEDVDTIDISSIAAWETTASADGLAQLRIRLIS